jgi:hypothetical protein
MPLDATTLTFPLIEGGILNHSKSVLEVYKLRPGKRLSENVNNLLVCRNVLELHCSLLYHVTDVVVLDLDVLRHVMKNWIF